MAQKLFGVDINMMGNSIVNFKPESVIELPKKAKDGRIVYLKQDWYDRDNDLVYIAGPYVYHMGLWHDMINAREFSAMKKEISDLKLTINKLSDRIKGLEDK